MWRKGNKMDRKGHRGEDCLCAASSCIFATKLREDSIVLYSTGVSSFSLKSVVSLARRKIFDIFSILHNSNHNFSIIYMIYNLYTNIYIFNFDC